MSDYDLERQAEDASNLYELAILNDNVAIKARPDGKYIRYKKAIDRPTQEAIDEYNEQFEVGKQVDDEGRVHKFFVPENVPALEAFAPSVIPLTIDELVTIEEDIQTGIDEYTRMQQYLIELDTYKQEARDRFNEADPFEWADLQVEIADIDREIVRARAMYERALADVEILQAIKAEDSGNKSIYQKELQETKKVNQERIKHFKDELNQMNQGAFSMTQSPDETEEDFLLRLAQNAETLEPEEISHKAVANALRTFKEKLKELVRNDVTIGQVSNRIDDFGEIENKMKLLKTFPKFKKYFLEKYGFNNKQVLPEVLLEEIENYIKKSDKPILIADKAVDDLLEADEADVEAEGFTQPIKKPFPGLQFQSQPEANRMKIENVKESPPTVLYLRPALVGRTKELLFSFTGMGGSWINVRESKIDRKSSQVIFERTGIFLKELEVAFGSKTIKGIAENLFRKYDIPFSSDVDLEIDTYRGEDITRYGMGIKAKPSYGYGLPEELQKFSKLGKAVIMTKKLFYENILSLCMENGSKFPGFKNVKVSERFVEIIMQLLKGNKPSSHTLKQLDSHERELFDQMIYLAGLHKHIEHTGDKTIESLKHRLELLQGEIGVGNDNPELFKEIKSIIKRLVEMKFLTAKNAKEYLSQF